MFLVCRAGETKYKAEGSAREMQIAGLDVVAEEAFFSAAQSDSTGGK